MGRAWTGAKQKVIYKFDFHPEKIWTAVGVFPDSCLFLGFL